MNNNLCKDLNYGYDYNNGIFEKKIPNFKPGDFRFVRLLSGVDDVTPKKLSRVV